MSDPVVTTSFINIFNEVIDLPCDQQISYIEENYGEDEKILEELKSMLAIYQEQPGEFLEEEVTKQAFIDRSNEAIGNYQLLEHIGSGGMGDVYTAKRNDGLHENLVAIKIINSANLQADTLERFRQERRILSTLHSPYIAKLLDGGSTDAGQPYYVMDYIEGLPIDEYCREQKLGIRERLVLFQKVCAAVFHAHQHLIIHRDLKPSNILVTKNGEPKLLDFGIAKIVTDKSTNTGNITTKVFAGIPMTPQYASPEQFLDQPLTPASDIYSLGIILYQLLSESMPYPAPARNNFSSWQKIVCRHQPEKPSEKVLSLANRPSYLTSAGKVLKGDLDVITLKALHKEPERRYSSALELVNDIEHYLTGSPIQARKDSLFYVLSRVIQKNWLLSSTIALSLGIGIGAVGIQQYRILEERDIAVSERDKANELAEFLIDIFKVRDPSEISSKKLDIKTIVEESTDKIQKKFQQQPKLQADLLLTLSRIYRNIGDFETAGKLINQSLDLRNSIFITESIPVANALAQKGKLLRLQANYNDAEMFLNQAIDIYKNLESKTNNFAAAFSELGIVYEKLGKLDLSISCHNKAISIYTALNKPDSEVLANVYTNLGVAYWHKEEFDTAIVNYDAALALYSESIGLQQIDVALTYDNLGLAHWNKGELDTALEYYLKSLDIKENIYESPHSNIALTYSNLGIIYSDQGEFDLSLAAYKNAENIYLVTLGADHPHLADTYTNIAIAYAKQGLNESAIEYFEKDLQINLTALGSDHQFVANTRSNLALVLIKKEEYQSAIQLLDLATPALISALGETHSWVVEAYQGYASAYSGLKENSKATEYYNKVHSIQSKTLGSDHPDTIKTAGILSKLDNVSSRK